MKDKIKVDIVHKPKIGNIWIYLTLNETLQEHFNEHNLSPPMLIAFTETNIDLAYKNYCKYVGSDEFQSIFIINSFIQ